MISQIKGYFSINTYLSLSLAITIFSFAGIPPLVGFFAKQMVISAALDSGYIFLTLISILTSVIGAVYYLGIIKQVFFDRSEYKRFLVLKKKSLKSFLKFYLAGVSMWVPATTSPNPSTARFYPRESSPTSSAPWSS